MGLAHVEFREGLLENLPVEDGWADVVISNGVLNLMPDKEGAVAEMFRVLKPGGVLALSRDLFDREPEAWLLGIRGYAFDEFGETLTLRLADAAARDRLCPAGLLTAARRRSRLARPVFLGAGDDAAEHAHA